jgi:hypothetical protein
VRSTLPVLPLPTSCMFPGPGGNAATTYGGGICANGASFVEVDSDCALVGSVTAKQNGIYRYSNAQVTFICGVGLKGSPVQMVASDELRIP